MENRIKKLSVILFMLMGFISYAIADTVEDYKKYCIEGNAKGCYNLGWAYYEGNAVEIDYITAKEYLEIACDYEVGIGCSKLGEMYTKGKGVKKNNRKAREYYGKAKEYYRKVCDLNDADGCSSLGVMYEVGREGIERNYTKAREYYKKACDLNDKIGCFYLGLMYESGEGVKRDYDKAREYYRNLDAGLYMTLGVIYESGGDGIDQSDTKAREYYKKACDLDESLCIFLTGYKEDKHNNSTDSGSLIIESNKIKEYVLGVIKHGSAQFNYPMGTMPKDMATGADAEYIAEYVSGGMRGEEPAAFAACAACHGDDGRGSGGLSADLLNLKGIKFEVKVNSKVMKYRDACDRGDGFACYDLALVYETGKYGLDKDLEKAITYYIDAFNSGKKGADKKIEEIALLLLGSSRAQLLPNKADSEIIKFAKEFIRNQKKLRELSDLIQK